MIRDLQRNPGAFAVPRLALWIGLIAGVASSCERTHPVTLSVDGRSNENVTIAASGQLVAVAWAGAASTGTDIYSAVSRDGGASFDAPVRVNSVAGDARTGGEQPPQVALVPGSGVSPSIVVVWSAKRPEGTRLLVARSTDGGRSFGATSIVRGSEANGNRGWESVAVDSAGRVLALWLDHRNAPVMGAMHHHQADGKPVSAASLPKPDPVEKAELSQLLFAALDDSTPPRSVTGGVCYCCKTALAEAHGRVFAAWRHVFPGNQRDIGFSASRDGGVSFAPLVRVSDDHWTFDGCPENGPAIAIDDSARVHVVWPTPLDGTPESPLALFYARSDDGQSFAPRVRIPTRGAAFHARLVAAPGGSLFFAWEEQNAGGRIIKLARGQAGSGNALTVKELTLPANNAGTYPALAVTVRGVVLAWVRRSGAGNVINVVNVAAK